MLLLSLLVLSVFSLAGVFGEDISSGQRHFMETVASCKDEWKIEDRELEKMELDEWSKSDKMKEFATCVGIKGDFMDEDGKPHKEAIKAFLEDGFSHTPNVSVDDIIENCIVQKDTPKETAFNFFKCFIETQKY